MAQRLLHQRQVFGEAGQRPLQAPDLPDAGFGIIDQCKGREQTIRLTSVLGSTTHAMITVLSSLRPKVQSVVERAT